MPRPKATDSLSDEGQRLMLQGFANSRTAAWIAQSIEDGTGEVVATRTIARRAAEYRAEVAQRTAARQRMEDLVAAMKAGNLDAGEMIQALAMDTLVYDPDALTGQDPVKVQRLALVGQKLTIEKRKLELQERVVSVDERRVRLLEERQRRLTEALDPEAKPEMSPEDRLREVYSILSLPMPTGAPAHA